MFSVFTACTDRVLGSFLITYYHEQLLLSEAGGRVIARNLLNQLNIELKGCICTNLSIGLLYFAHT